MAVWFSDAAWQQEGGHRSLSGAQISSLHALCARLGQQALQKPEVQLSHFFHSMVPRQLVGGPLAGAPPVPGKSRQGDLAELLYVPNPATPPSSPAGSLERGESPLPYITHWPGLSGISLEKWSQRLPSPSLCAFWVAAPGSGLQADHNPCIIQLFWEEAVAEVLSQESSWPSQHPAVSLCTEPNSSTKALGPPRSSPLPDPGMLLSPREKRYLFSPAYKSSTEWLARYP